MPLVSIITPSYNQARYLEQTIQSVLAQSYPALEYIIVDGGSTDGSQAIIRKYANQLAWWVSEPDLGQADALNKGLRRARGEVVAWLNSDDVYLPGAVGAAVLALEANPAAGMVFGDAITINEEGVELNRLVFGDWGLQELMRFRIICQPAVFMRRRALEQAGGLDQAYHFLLDHHLWLRLAQRAPVCHVAATWAAARYHMAAKNVSQAAGFGQEAFRILHWMEDQPDLQPRLQKDRRRIEAGAYRLNARYLLDGGQPAAALRSYLQALWRSPRFALQHWHRMLYAAASLAGARSLADRYSHRS
jgi:glycosyltransferase involved in cell wall biosynthesis